VTEARRTSKKYGRHVTRHLQASWRLAETLDWPGVKQVLRLERTTIRRGKRQVEVEYAITSLPPDRADAGQLLTYWVGHWGIENRLHWVRDAVFGEDACRAKKGHSPQNLAALRNACLTLLRSQSINAILPALRHFSHRLDRLMKLLGIMKN